MRIAANGKILHLVRHAQGEHNAACAIDEKNAFSEEYEDPNLTELGRGQCAFLAENVQANDALTSAQLLVVSPMKRTIQTALGSFPHLTEKFPWVACEHCREQSGAHPCDRRRPISELKELFPKIDFSEIESDVDPLYPKYGDVREPIADLNQRNKEFLMWIASRPEREIIVVTHSAFLESLLRDVLKLSEGQDDCWFENCEMRTYAVNLPPKAELRRSSCTIA